MNNKGMAITGIMYLTLILFVMLLLSFLSILKIKGDNFIAIDTGLRKDLASSYQELNLVVKDNYIINTRGKYLFEEYNGTTLCTGELYLAKDTTILVTDKIMIDDQIVDVCRNDNSKYYFIKQTTSDNNLEKNLYIKGYYN